MKESPTGGVAEVEEEKEKEAEREEESEEAPTVAETAPIVVDPGRRAGLNAGR